MHSALCKNVPFVKNVPYFNFVTKFRQQQQLCASYFNNLGSSIPIFVPSDQILGSSSSVSESSSAEKSIAGLLSNADFSTARQQLRRFTHTAAAA